MSLQSKLRRKFLFISMASCSLVLFIIVIGMNIYNLVKINNQADSMLDIITKDSDKPIFKPNKLDHIPFEMRYYFVDLTDNEILFVNINKNEMVTKSTVEELARSLYDDNEYSGYSNYTKYKRIDYETKTTYYFIDMSRDFNNYFNFLIGSITVSVAGLLFVFILLYIFSKRAIRPIVDAHIKQQEFITNASHEIKTPLTIISSAIDILKFEDIDNEWTKAISTEVIKMTELTNSLTKLSKLDEESKTKASNIDITSLLNEVKMSFTPKLQKSNINVYEKVSDTKLTIEAIDFSYIISILLDNAIKYNSGDYIEIKLNSKLLEMKNKVENITPGDYSRVFNRFYRIDESHSSKTKGFGIGLSIVKAICDRYKYKAIALVENDEFIVRIILK